MLGGGSFRPTRGRTHLATPDACGCDRKRAAFPDDQLSRWRAGQLFHHNRLNFPPDAQATLSINGQVITRLLRTNATGSFIFFLDTTGAGTGNYDVTVSVNPSATTSLTLADGAPLRPQEGGGRTVTFFQTDRFIYLPLVKK